MAKNKVLVKKLSANNIAFYTLAFAQLVHPINLIKRSDHLLKNEIVQNRYLWFAILFCTLLMVGIYWIQPVKSALNLDPFHVDGILIIAIASILPILIIRILKEIGFIN
jgi:Ca2+-transporting ATPase